jgi:hypothetical protein
MHLRQTVGKPPFEDMEEHLDLGYLCIQAKEHHFLQVSLQFYGRTLSSRLWMPFLSSRHLAIHLNNYGSNAADNAKTIGTTHTQTFLPQVGNISHDHVAIHSYNLLRRYFHLSLCVSRGHSKYRFRNARRKIPSRTPCSKCPRHLECRISIHLRICRSSTTGIRPQLS